MQMLVEHIIYYLSLLGHGGITANIKLMKMFIERGAAGCHIEDQVYLMNLYLTSFLGTRN